MNIKSFNSIIYSSFLIGLMLLSNKSYAVDMEVLQEQCADIGFKIKTPANGKCVLRLMKSVKAEEKTVESQEKAYADQQAAIAAQAQQAEALRQQEAQMLQLQRESVAAQQQAAQAQTEAVDYQKRMRLLGLFQKSLSGGSTAQPSGYTLAPDGTYVGGSKAILTPNGTYVGQ
jgi:hypothetical protein